MSGLQVRILPASFFKEEKKMIYIKSVMNGMKNETSSQQEENNLDYYNHIPFFKKINNNEYKEAQENGFKGTIDKIEEYLEIRDYT